jgi:hypothetical protein
MAMLDGQRRASTTRISYDAFDAPLASEEDDEGNIIPTAALDDQMYDLDEEEPAVVSESEGIRAARYKSRRASRGTFLRRSILRVREFNRGN